MLHILLQVSDRSAHLHLVLPLILSPFLLEFKFCALCRLKCVDEVNLDLIDVDHEGDISTGGVESKVAVDSSVVGRADLQRALNCCSLLASERHCHGLLYNFKVALG